MYSVCSLCSQCSEIFTDEQCSSAILWIKLVAVLCQSNHDEDYDIWVVKFAIILLVKLQPLSCECSLKHLAFHLLSSFENSANVWLVAHLAYVNVDKVTTNYVCFRKQNFRVHFSRFCGLSRCYCICKICKSTCSHTIISQETLFVTKSNIFKSTWVIKFSVSQFHTCNLSFAMFIQKHGSATLWIIKLAFMQI